jgi:hypothetical protein
MKFTANVRGLPQVAVKIQYPHLKIEKKENPVTLGWPPYQKNIKTARNNCPLHAY